MAHGREVDSAHNGYFPPETDIQVDDEITVTKGDYSPTQFKVQFPGHHGPRWDIACDLSESTTKLS